MEEATNCEAARSWKYCGPQWDNAESDRFTSVMSTIPNKAVVIGNGDKGLSVGGRGRVEKGKRLGVGTGTARRVNYVHCRTGKGNLQAWRHVLDSDISD